MIGLISLYIAIIFQKNSSGELSIQHGNDIA